MLRLRRLGGLRTISQHGPRSADFLKAARASAEGAGMIPSVISIRYGALAAVLAAIYFVVAKLSLLLAIPPGYATAIWPPAGVALAAVLVFGPRIWPGVWLGAILVNSTVEYSWAAA